MINWPDNDSRSRQLYDRALNVMPGGITRIVPWQEPFPVYADSGSGAYVRDVDGAGRMDFLNNFASLIHGHAHPAIVEAVISQVGLGTVFAMPTEAEVKLAELLCERIGTAEWVRFSNSGSEAVMCAIKAARALTGRPAIVKIEGGYHGSYDYAEVSLAPPRESWELPPRSVGYSAGVPGSVLDDVLVVPFNDSNAAEQVIRRYKDRIAALLLDATPSQFGFLPISADFAARMRALATEIGAMMILDEVISLRLHRGGGQEFFSIKPDLTVMGKIIGGGFPIGAVAGPREVMKVFDHRTGKPPVPWSGTFTANPVSMTAGLVSMELLTADLIDHINQLGDQVRHGLTEAFRSAGYPGQVTGVGSLFKLHAHDRPIHDYRSQLHTDAENQTLLKLQKQLVNKGYHVSGTGMGFISTVMTSREIGRFCSVVEECLRLLPHSAQDRA